MFLNITNSQVIHFPVYLLYILMKIRRKIILVWTMNSIAKMKNVSLKDTGVMEKKIVQMEVMKTRVYVVQFLIILEIRM